jgi:PAS domain S-box-containing protein
MQLIAPSLAQSRMPVKVGVYQNTPLTFIDENGKVGGFFIDILESIAGKENWKIEYVQSSFSECLSNLESGRIDLLGALAYSESRGKLYNFTFESVFTNWGQMYINNNTDIESIIDLEGKKIAVLQGDIYFENLRKLVNQFGIQCEFIEAFEYEDVLKLVEIGRCQAGLVSQIYGLQNERNYDISKSSILVSPQRLYWAVPKGKNQKLLFALDKRTRELKSDERSIYYEAINKWFGIGVKSKLGRWFKWIIISFLSLLALFITSSLILRVQVKSKTKELLIKNEELLEEIKNRKQVEEALRDSEEKYRTILDNVEAMYYELDLDGNITVGTDSGARFLGGSRDEFIGKNFAEFCDEENVKALFEIYHNVYETGRPAKAVEWNVTTLDGTRKSIEASAALMRDADGEPIGFRGIAQDMTERKKAQEELKKAKKEADEANRTKGQFLANMSHEIRTPMNAIMGMTHLALQTKLSPKQHDYLNKIKTSADFLLSIINDILDFSKIEAGKLEMESVDFNLDEVMHNLAPVVIMKSQEKENLEVLFDIAQNVPRLLKGDPLRLGQVLLNLASNAVKFTEEGEIIISARLIKDEKDQASLEFSVSDTGVGLTQAQTDNLFEAFTQADTSTTRKHGGTGLGLSICKSLVEMMGGEIRVESEPDRGSTFIFTANFGRSEQKEKKVLEPSPDLRGMRVLVVDDNASSREILMGMLESFSFEVSLAASGEEGLRELEDASEERPYDLVLMDWKMPGMNGIEASRRIKNHPGLAKIPTIIMVTAYSRESIMRQADQIGLEGFLVKPVSPSVLFDTIMQACGKKVTETSKIAKRKEQEAEALRYIQGAQILLVEDNEINQEVARELLERSGLPVTIAANGEEAVRAVKEKDFEVVLMDIQMPVMDGYQATREIRKDERLKDLPIIAMTAHAMTGDREGCLAAGMNDYMTKPIDPEKLFSTLIKWIKPGERAIPDYLLAETDEESPEDEDLPLSDLPGVSMKSGLTKVGGNRELYQKLLRKFRRNHADDANDMRKALDKDDTGTATRLAHTMKGLAGNLGAHDLHMASANLETDLRLNRTENIPGLFNAFSEALDLVMNSITALEPGKPDTAVAGLTAQPAPESLDRDRAHFLLSELKKFLEKDDFRAVKTLEDLRAALPGGMAEDELADLEKHIEEYAFEKALESLVAVTQALDNSL